MISGDLCMFVSDGSDESDNNNLGKILFEPIFAVFVSWDSGILIRFCCNGH